jgi:hypothetical protein
MSKQAADERLLITRSLEVVLHDLFSYLSETQLHRIAKGNSPWRTCSDVTQLTLG